MRKVSLLNAIFLARQKASEKINKGRFPASVILDEEAGKLLDEQVAY